MRTGLSVELAAELQDGALGEINPRAKNRAALRTDINERRGATKEATVEELRLTLLEGAGKVSDLFKAFDRDGDGRVMKQEFVAALPLLGYDTSDMSAVDELWAELDEDGSGTLEYAELSSKVRTGLSVELAAELQDGACGEMEEWGSPTLNHLADDGANASRADTDPATARAATTVQAVQRGRMARFATSRLELADPATAKAATTVQAVQRGRMVRSAMRTDGSPSGATAEHAYPTSADHDTTMHARAATTLQAVQRGRIARKGP